MKSDIDDIKETIRNAIRNTDSAYDYLEEVRSELSVVVDELDDLEDLEDQTEKVEELEKEVEKLKEELENNKDLNEELIALFTVIEASLTVTELETSQIKESLKNFRRLHLDT